MKKIIVSAIVAIVVTVGAHLIALALGASEPAFVATVVAVATVFATAAIAAAFAAAFVTSTITGLAFATAAIATVADATVPFTIAATAAFAAIAAAAATVAKDKRVKLRWAFAAYVLEAATIIGAFMVNSTVWSIAIALSGVVALLVLWRLAPKRRLATNAPSATAISERNGA